MTPSRTAELIALDKRHVWHPFTPMRQWWQGKITNWMGGFAIAGIWNDIDEPEQGDQIPYNGLLWCDGHYGTSATDSRRQWSNEHNYFGLRCAGTSYGALLLANPNKRPFVLSRSGSCGLQRYAVSWSGDTVANWGDGSPNNSGNSAMGYARTCIPFGPLVIESRLLIVSRAISPNPIVTTAR